MAMEHKEATKEELAKLADQAVKDELDLSQFDFSLPETKAVENLWGNLLWQSLQLVHQIEALIYGNRAAKNEAKVNELTLQLLAAKYTAAQIQKHHLRARAAMLEMLADKQGA